MLIFSCFSRLSKIYNPNEVLIKLKIWYCNFAVHKWHWRFYLTYLLFLLNLFKCCSAYRLIGLFLWTIFITSNIRKWNVTFYHKTMWYINLSFFVLSKLQIIHLPQMQRCNLDLQFEPNMSYTMINIKYCLRKFIFQTMACCFNPKYNYNYFLK